MKLTEFLTVDNIQQGVLVSSKKRALELIGKLAADKLNAENKGNPENAFCPVQCFSNLFKREKLGKTALNSGVALPHSKLPENDRIELDKPVAFLLQLEQGIDFDAEDHKEVDLIYAVLFPAGNCEFYCAGLSELAQRLTDKNLLKQLRTAQSAEDIWHILYYADQHLDKREE